MPKGGATIALLKLSSFVKGISGKSGNAVYRITKYGTEIADRPTVNNPDTPAQNVIRNAFSKVTKQWKTLTTAQAAAWNAYAATRAETERASGVKATRSGFNWFVGFGTRYLTVNPLQNAAPTSPPATDFVGDAISITPAAQAGGIKFTASAANASKTTTALLIQKLRNGNAKPGKQYLTKQHFQFTSGSLNTVVSLPPGVYSVGYQFVNIDTGQETDMVLLGTVGPVTFVVSGSESNKKAA